MDGLPVTIRLLDPPLHEFLPDRYEVRDELKRAELESTWDLPELQQQVAASCARSRRPTRCSAPAACGSGSSTRRSTRCRCGRSLRAARAVHGRTGDAARRRDHDPARRLRAGARRSSARWSCGSPPRRASRDGRATAIGTMIELPRACLVADAIAQHAEFFSFGTNDLTQTALGLLARRHRGQRSCRRTSTSKILDVSPFESIDEDGLGQLVRHGAASAAARRGPACTSASAASTAATRARSRFFHRAGLDYVSCSPFRVPIARVAAAQAAIAAACRAND